MIARPKTASAEDRILVLAPTGADSRNAASILEAGGFHGQICDTLPELCDLARESAGALMVAEESLQKSNFNLLIKVIQAQPSWSDLPILVVTSGGHTTAASQRAYDTFGLAANLILIERPFRAITLVSAARAALRSRRRQYEVRGLLEDLEAKVSERTVRLEQTIAELEAFSYTVSHDLRAPLRAMRGYAEVLLQDYAANLDETGLQYLQRIQVASERLDRLVQDVLRYSRVARDKIECVPLDLDNLVRGVVSEYPGFQSGNAQIIVASPLHPVLGHEASLTQVVSNLLGNAIKFVHPGLAPKVKIWTEPAAPYVKIFFADNGIGIERADYDKIFKMFERVSTGLKVEGTGIGLAIVAKAVERMDGKVSVDSVVGRGSSFCIELPAAE